MENENENENEVYWFEEIEFVDGATIHGPWGCMCLSCFRKYGIGIGPGRGQLYQLQPGGRWKKIKG
jgi:hypothetical protein